jgi:hypothetical protein
MMPGSLIYISANFPCVGFILRQWKGHSCRFISHQLSKLRERSIPFPPNPRADSYWCSLCHILFAELIPVVTWWGALIGQSWIWREVKHTWTLRSESQREKVPQSRIQVLLLEKGNDCYTDRAGILANKCSPLKAHSGMSTANSLPAGANAAGPWTTLCVARGTLPGVNASSNSLRLLSTSQ